MEVIYFRWYNLAAAVLGLCCVYLGYAAYKNKNHQRLLIFCVLQGVGLLLVFVGALLTYTFIAYYDTDCKYVPSYLFFPLAFPLLICSTSPPSHGL